MADNGLKERVREYYEKNRIPFLRLAAQSLVLFNAEVTIDQLKHWSSEDGGWKKPPINNQQKLNIISERIFEVIEENPFLDPKDLATLANIYLNYSTKVPAEQFDDNRPTMQQIIDAVRTHGGKME